MPASLSSIVQCLVRGGLEGIASAPSTRLRLRVRLRDVDFNLHMNYATYLQAMELGRWHWAARAGLVQAWVRRRLRPVAGSVSIDYKRELRPLVSYVLTTTLAGVDRRALVFAQAMHVGERLHAEATVNVLILGRGGVLPPDESMALVPPSMRPPSSA